MIGQIDDQKDAVEFINSYAEFTSHSTREIATGLILANLEDQNYNSLVSRLDRRGWAGWDWYNAEYPFIDAFGQDLANAVLDIAEEFVSVSAYTALAAELDSEF